MAKKKKKIYGPFWYMPNIRPIVSFTPLKPRPARFFKAPIMTPEPTRNTVTNLILQEWFIDPWFDPLTQYVLDPASELYKGSKTFVLWASEHYLRAGERLGIPLRADDDSDRAMGWAFVIGFNALAIAVLPYAPPVSVALGAMPDVVAYSAGVTASNLYQEHAETDNLVMAPKFSLFGSKMFGSWGTVT
jgi:hypothetical protein